MFSPLELKALILLTRGQVKSGNIQDPIIKALVNANHVITPTVRSWEDIGCLLIEGLILGAKMRLSTITHIIQGVHNHNHYQSPKLNGLVLVE